MALLNQVRPQTAVPRPSSHRAHQVGAILSRDGREVGWLCGYRHLEAKSRNAVSAWSDSIKLETLKIIVRYAIDWRIVLDTAATKFKRRKQPNSMIELPSHSEFRTLVKSFRNAPLTVAFGATALVEFPAHTGMRVGEPHEVRFEDVKLEVGSMLTTGGEWGRKLIKSASSDFFRTCETCSCASSPIMTQLT